MQYATPQTFQNVGKNIDSAHGFRFESFFINHLEKVGAMEHRSGLEARFRMVLNAITEGEGAGYIGDVPTEANRNLNLATATINPATLLAEGRVMVMDSLVANGYLDELSWKRWRNVAQMHDLTELAPTLLRQIAGRHNVMKTDGVLDIMNQAFLATSPNSAQISDEMVNACRERPRDPICMVGATHFGSYTARTFGREVAIMAKFFEHGLLKDDQVNALYDTCYRDITRWRGVTDLTQTGGADITSYLNVKVGARADIWTNAMANVGSVAIYGPDSPFADVCSKTNPPPICRAIKHYPVAANLTASLVSFKLWDKQQAISAWDRVAVALDTVTDTVVTKR